MHALHACHLSDLAQCDGKELGTATALLTHLIDHEVKQIAMLARDTKGTWQATRKAAPTPHTTPALGTEIDDAAKKAVRVMLPKIIAYLALHPNTKLFEVGACYFGKFSTRDGWRIEMYPHYLFVATQQRWLHHGVVDVRINERIEPLVKNWLMSHGIGVNKAGGV